MKKTDYSTKFAKRQQQQTFASSSSSKGKKSNLNNSSIHEESYLPSASQIDHGVSVEGKFAGLHLSTASCAAIVASVSDEVQAIDFSHNVIDHLPEALPANVLGVDFSHNFLRDLSISSSSWGHIIELNLSNNHITSVIPLTPMYSLQYLDVSHNQLTCIEGLESMKDLKILKAQHNVIQHLAGLRTLSYNRSLEEIDLTENPISYFESDIRIQISNLIPTIKIISHETVKSKHGHAIKGYSSLLQPQTQTPLLLGPSANNDFGNAGITPSYSQQQPGEFAHLPVSPQSSTSSDFSASQSSSPDPDDILLEMQNLRNTKRSSSSSSPPPPPPPPLPVESMSRVPSLQDIRKYSLTQPVIDLDEGSVATDSVTENPTYENIHSLMRNRGVVPNTTVKELHLDDDNSPGNLTYSNSASTLATTPAAGISSAVNPSSKSNNKVMSKLPWRKPPDIQPRLKRKITTVSLKDRSISPPSRSMDRSALLASQAMSPTGQRPPRPPMKSPEEKAKDRQTKENKKLVNMRHDTLNKYYAFQQRELDKTKQPTAKEHSAHHHHESSHTSKKVNSGGDSLDGNQSEISDHPSVSHNSSLLNKSSNLMFTYSQEDPDSLHNHHYDPFNQLHHVMLDSERQSELDDEVNQCLEHLAQLNVIPNLVPVQIPIGGNPAEDSFHSVDAPLNEDTPSGSRWMSPLLKGRIRPSNGPNSPVAFGIASRGGNDSVVPPLRGDSPVRVPPSSLLEYSTMSRRAAPERKPSPTKSTVLLLQHQDKKKAMETKKQQQREYSFAKSPLKSRPNTTKEKVGKTTPATPNQAIQANKATPKADVSIFHEPSSNRLYYGNKSFSLNTSRMSNLVLEQHASKMSAKMGVSELGDVSQGTVVAGDVSTDSVVVEEKENKQASAYKKLLQFNEIVANRAVQGNGGKSTGHDYYELTYGFLRNLESAEDMLKYSHQINALYEDLLHKSSSHKPHDKDYLVSDYYELVKRRALIMKFIQETFPVPPPPPPNTITPTISSSQPIPLLKESPPIVKALPSDSVAPEQQLVMPASNPAPSSRPITPTIVSGINASKQEDYTMPETIKLSEAIGDLKETQIRSLSSLSSIKADPQPQLSLGANEEQPSTPSTADIVNAINELRMKQMQSIHQLKSQKSNSSNNSLSSSQQ